MVDEAPFFQHLYRGRSFTPDPGPAPGPHISSRLAPLEQDAEGFEAVIATKGRALLSVRQIAPHNDFDDFSVGLGRLVMVFHLEGARDTFLDDVPALSMREPCLAVYYHGLDVRMRSRWLAGGTERAVIIGCWPRDLPSGALEALEGLPQFNGLSAMRQDRVIAHQLPLNARMRRCVTEISQLRMSRQFIGHYLEAKTLEAQCLAIDQILETMRSDQDVLSNHQAIVREAVARIEQHIECPDELPLAARNAGMAPRVFSKVFQSVTGERYPEFIGRLRVERAYELLCTTDLPLKVIAHQIGYGYPSNLSAALSRTYGKTPRDIRRSHAGPDHIHLKP